MTSHHSNFAIPKEELQKWPFRLCTNATHLTAIDKIVKLACPVSPTYSSYMGAIAGADWHAEWKTIAGPVFVKSEVHSKAKNWRTAHCKERRRPRDENVELAKRQHPTSSAVVFAWIAQIATPLGTDRPTRQCHRFRMLTTCLIAISKDYSELNTIP